VISVRYLVSVVDHWTRGPFDFRGFVGTYTIPACRDDLGGWCGRAVRPVELLIARCPWHRGRPPTCRWRMPAAGVPLVASALLSDHAAAP
jgi:hypothetical protein